MPLLVLQNDGGAAALQAGRGQGRSASASPGGSSGPSWKLTSQTNSAAAPGTPAAAPPTTTSPTTAPPTTTTAPPVSVPSAVVVQRSVPVPTTTTVPPTTTTAPVVAIGSVYYGQVTYYAHPAGTCASPFLPFGTVVRVTNPANGLSVTCLVNDREADTARSIDLATATFAELAPLSQGVTAWQEEYGTQAQKVTVGAGAPAKLDFTYKAK